MAVLLLDHLVSLRDQLRAQPVSKRIRASDRGEPVLETTDAMLVWEPRRVVPMYAVPPGDFRADLEPCASPAPPERLPAMLGPVRFEWHLVEGQAFTVVTAAGRHDAAAFAPADPDLGGRAIVNWAPFDWTEEAAPMTGHPHDPFARLDVLPSDRHVVVSLRGRVLADSRRPVALYETGLPVRWYLPRDDVQMDLLGPSDTTSICAYKGQAGYFSLTADPEGRDLAWTYVDPLPEASLVKDHVCFWSERTDLRVDGVDVPRPSSPWSTPAQAALA